MIKPESRPSTAKQLLRAALAAAALLIAVLIVAVIAASGSLAAAWHVAPAIWDRITPG